MIDYVIFGFGLFVTVIVGSGLATMIVTHNREIQRNTEKTDSSSKSDT